MPTNPTHGDEYQASDESTRVEIITGKAEGTAYGAALKYLAQFEASDSGEQNAEDDVIAYAVEDAEGLYHMQEGKLEWREPEQENCHIEIAVRNAADGRFLPCLSVRATLRDNSGKVVGTQEMPFLWHPWIYHYGRNWTVPRDGEYGLLVQIDAPEFPRHDKIKGKRFQNPIEVEFHVKIKTGRKISRAA